MLKLQPLGVNMSIRRFGSLAFVAVLALPFNAEAQITRVIPLRFVQVLDCDPGPACPPHITPIDLQANVDRANEIYSAAGVKFWIKSNERRNLPDFVEQRDVSRTWDEVKSSLKPLFPNMPETAYASNESKKLFDWLSAVSAIYGDDDEIIVWIHAPCTSTTGCVDSSNKSFGEFPEGGRSVRMQRGMMSGRDTATGATWQTTALAHDIGHYLGLRHPDAPVGGTNPESQSAWAAADFWDLLYCDKGTSHRFFSSRSDFTNYGCTSTNVKAIAHDDACTSTTRMGGTRCTLGGNTYSPGDSEYRALLFSYGTPQTPPTSFNFGINVMDYYSYYGLDTRVPSQFSTSQLLIISKNLDYDVSYSSRDQQRLKRSDGKLPPHATADAMTSRRSALGFSTDDFISFANGDVSFRAEEITVNGTNYTPAVGDLDNDANDDIAWYDPTTGLLNIWWARGDGTFFNAPPLTLGTGYRLFVGDFDGVNGDDLFLYAPGSKADYIYWSKGSLRSFQAGATSVTGDYAPVVGDFDANGVSDIAWYHSGVGTINLWWGNKGGTFTHENGRTAPTGAVAFAGNFDGSRGDDIFFYIAGAPMDEIWYSASTATGFDIRTTDVGGSYRPIVGDWNGDGSDDIYWDHPGTTDFVWLGNGKSFNKEYRGSIYGRFLTAAGNFDGMYGGARTSDILWYRE